MFKKTWQIALLLLVLIALVVGAATLYLNNYIDPPKQPERQPMSPVDQLSDAQKDALGLKDDGGDKIGEDTEEQKEHYTDDYKKYNDLSEEEKNEIDAKPRKFEVPEEELDNIIDNQKEDSRDLAEVPSKYDLRDHIKPDLKYQDGSICWIYASLTSVETHLQLHEKRSMRLSELRVDYFMSNKMYGYREPNSGGSFELFENYAVINGFIPRTDNDYYTDWNDKNNIIQLYDQEPEILVTETVKFPYLDKSKATEEEIKKYRDAVKRHIMTNGSLYFSASAPGALEVNVYCDREQQEESEFTCGMVNHALSIIGWDDDYSPQNWIDEHGGDTKHAPKHSGAYIVQNSWGPEAGKDGYHYFYYDHADLERDFSGVASTSLEDGAVKLSSIKNPNLRKRLADVFNTFIISKGGERYITNLTLDRRYNIDLSGLGLDNSDISDLTRVIKNTSQINLSNNNISDISFLKNLSNTYELSLSHNPIGTLTSDQLPPHLSSLACDDCKLTGVVDLKNTKLTCAYLSDNPGITEFSLPKNIYSISFANDGLKTTEQIHFSELDEQSVIQSIILDGNPDIADYSSLPPVSSLSIKNNGLVSLETIPHNYQVLEINASGNKLENLNGIPKRTKRLIVDNNPTIVDYSGLLKAEGVGVTDDSDQYSYYGNGYFQLSAANNNLKNLDLFAFTKDLNNDINLSLADNEIEEVTEPLEHVRCLTISNNKLGNNIQGLRGVRELYLENNNITNISSIGDSDIITMLNLSGNAISDLSSFNSLSSLAQLSISPSNAQLDGVLENNSIAFLSLIGSKLGDIGIHGKRIFLVNLNNAKISAEKAQATLDGLCDVNNIWMDNVADYLEIDNYLSCIQEKEGENWASTSLSIYGTILTNEQIEKYLDDGRLPEGVGQLNVTLSSSLEPVRADDSGTIRTEEYELRNSLAQVIYSQIMSGSSIDEEAIIIDKRTHFIKVLKPYMLYTHESRGYPNNRFNNLSLSQQLLPYSQN